MPSGFHEDLRGHLEVRGSSDRAFGLWFALFFSVIGLWPLLRGSAPKFPALALAGLFGVAAVAAPGVLAPLNRAWTRFGLLLGKVVNPIVMGIVFFGVVTPFAIFFRLTGRDLLRLGKQPEAPSYWIPREPPGPDPGTMVKQF